MYAELSAAASSVKVLGDMLLAIKDLGKRAEIIAAISDINFKIIAAQNVALAGLEKQSALADRVRELENAIAEAEGWKHEVDRYQLHEFPATGSLAYALKADMQQGQPAHYLCAACMDKRQISKMQKKGLTLHCHACGLTIWTQNPPPHEPVKFASEWSP